MIQPFRTARRRAVVLASGTAALLAIGGGTTAAFAAGSAPAPSASPAACRVHLKAELLGATPHALQADLKTLRSMPKGAKRAAERKEIRTKALSGAYGAQTERLAHIVGGTKGAVKTAAASWPAALQADLKTLRATEPKSAARTAEAAKIEQKAIAGDYGTTIQTRAKTVRAAFQERCAAAAK